MSAGLAVSGASTEVQRMMVDASAKKLELDTTNNTLNQHNMMRSQIEYSRQATVISMATQRLNTAKDNTEKVK